MVGTKIAAIVGYITVAIILVVVGAVYGSWRTENKYETERAMKASKDKDRELVVTDLLNITGKYQQLSNMCEDKYQLGIKGNIYDALEIKGQMTAIETEIHTILGKYSTEQEGSGLKGI